MFMCYESVPGWYSENTTWARGVASTGKVTNLGSPSSLIFFVIFSFFDGVQVRCNRRRKPRDRFDFPLSLRLFYSSILSPALPRVCDLSFAFPGPRTLSTMTSSPAECDSSSTPSRQTYKVYKRRFWGLAQLVLLNIVVSWDVGPHPRVSHCCNHVLTMTYIHSGSHSRRSQPPPRSISRSPRVPSIG